jgi:hypothetical protein
MHQYREIWPIWQSAFVLAHAAANALLGGVFADRQPRPPVFEFDAI